MMMYNFDQVIAREVKPFLFISWCSRGTVIIFLPLNKYNTHCPLWSSFNRKFKCLNEKSFENWRKNYKIQILNPPFLY
jgi:hypothetical protein